MQWTPCDLCGCSDFTVIFAHRDTGSPTDQPFRVVRCQDCGLVQLNPRPTDSDLAALYSHHHEDSRSGKERSGPPSNSLKRRLQRSLLERFYQYPRRSGQSPASTRGLLGQVHTAVLWLEQLRLRVIGREGAVIPFVGSGCLLDVGCADGRAMEALRELGWHVTGVEIDPHAASMARDRLGCEILVGDYEEVPIEDARFDVVRFCHSLEHLRSPKRALQKAHRILGSTGLVWIEIPNAASLERRLFGAHWFGWSLPRHLYHFTPGTLGRLLAQTGFRPIRLSFDGRALVFAESLGNVLRHWLGFRPRRVKWIRAMMRPLTTLLGVMNSGAIMFVQAGKMAPGRPIPLGGRVGMRVEGFAE